MRKSLKIKASRRSPVAKSVKWSARRAKVLMAYRSAGKAANCSK